MKWQVDEMSIVIFYREFNVMKLFFFANKFYKNWAQGPML